jgi:membrane protein DedA with SNARE-associated domain
MESWQVYLQALHGAPAYALVFGMLVACGLGAPFNEDIALLVASALTLSGVMDPVTLIAISFVGLIVGDACVFYWGHRFGPRLLRSRFFSRIVSEDRLAAFQERILRRGPMYIFVIRFLPGIRTPLFFAAGSLKLPYRSLFIYDGVAAMIELPALVYSVRFVGGNWHRILETIKVFQSYVVGGLLVLAAVFLVRRWLAKPVSTPSDGS